MTVSSEYKDCPKCGKAVRADAAMCGFCWAKFRDAPDEATNAEVSAILTPPNGPTTSTRESASRSYAVMQRYKDAYRVAKVVVSTGETIQMVGIGLAAVLILIGIVASSRVGFLALIASVPAAVLVGLVAWLSGVLLSAQGQLLQASLDGVINSSPFLNEEERAEAMSLPADGEHRGLPIS